VVVRQSHPEEEPVAVSIVIDTSGSMAPSDIAGAVAGANAVLDRLTPEDKSELVSFNTNITVIKSFDAPLDRNVLATLQRGGDTKLNDSVSGALDRIAAVPASTRAVIVLTDGVDDGSLTPAQAIIDKAATAGVAIHTIGLGRVDAPFLEALATRSSGSFRLAAAASELAALYANIAASLLTEYRLSYTSAARVGKHQLTVVAQAGDSKASTSVDFRLGPQTAAAEADDGSGQSSALPLVLAGGAILLALAGLFLLLRLARRNGAEAPPLQGQRADGLARAPASLLSYHLVGENGMFPLSGPTVIGRDPRADIVVSDETVSRSHARLEEFDGGILIQDLGSANGTMVNGVTVSRQVAHPGDLVSFGDLTFELRAPG
jgi:hypothetical protein